MRKHNEELKLNKHKATKASIEGNILIKSQLRISLSSISPFEGLKSASSSTSLPSGAVGWDWGHILNSADLKASTSQGSQSALGSWAWGLGAVSAGSADLHVQGSHVERLMDTKADHSSEHIM